jgi:1,2-diacylglycerol 3-alpha-glucosyltransferase
MESLRIAIYTDTFLPARDGVVTYILTLRKELERLGHEVIIATTARETASKADWNNVYVSRGYKFPLYPQYSISPVPFSVNKKIMDLKVDIVHSQTPLMMGFAGLRYSKLKKIPCISTFHSLIFHESILNAYLPDNTKTVRTVEMLMKHYLKWHYLKCDETIVPSEFVKCILSRELSVDAKVVNNAIDIYRYLPTMSKSEARSRLNIDDSSIIVLFLGRISREKNLEVILKAAKLAASNIRFLILGSGPHLAYYKDMANNLGLRNVDFLGFVDDSLAPLYFRAADIFCNPSNFEVMSTVDIESLAAGTPILVPDRTSQEELLFDGKTGLSFRNADPADLNSKIGEMFSNKSSFSTVDYARKFTPEKHVESLLNIYRSALDKR